MHDHLSGDSEAVYFALEFTMSIDALGILVLVGIWLVSAMFEVEYKACTAPFCADQGTFNTGTSLCFKNKRYAQHRLGCISMQGTLDANMSGEDGMNDCQNIVLECYRCDLLTPPK